MATRGLPTWPLLHDEADALPPGEALLLDALRAWAAPGSPGPLGQAALVLAAAGADAAAIPLDALLRALPGVQPCGRLCPRLHPAEADLLLALGAAQGGRRSLALALLARHAAPLAAYRAMPLVIALAAALRGCGVALGPRL